MRSIGFLVKIPFFSKNMIVSASLFPKTDSVFPRCTPDGKPEREHNVTAIALMVIGLLLFVIGALLLLLWAPPSQPCLIVSSCCLGVGTVLIGSGVGKICHAIEMLLAE